MTDVKPVRTAADYAVALARIDTLMAAKYGGAEGDELDLLADYVSQYESEREPMGRYNSDREETGIGAEELAERYPRLYHASAAGAWPSIERHGLLSASELLDRSDVSEERRTKLKSCHRPESEKIHLPDSGYAVLRDQKPMNEKKLRECLCDGLIPADWYRILNSKIFFWVTRERIERMLNACEEMRQTVLIVDTESLLADHFESTFLSPINNGSTLFDPSARGRGTFLPPERYPFRHRRKSRGPRDAIAELAVEGGVHDIRKHVLSVEERGARRPTLMVWRRAPDG